MGHALRITDSISNVISLPNRPMGRSAHKAKRMAMLMLVEPTISQGVAAERAGYSHGMTNSRKTIKTKAFQVEYSRLQQKLRVELPFEWLRRE